MKKLLFLLLLLPVLVNAQSFKADPDTKGSYLDEPAYMIDTVVVSALTKAQLYSNALAYVANSFNDSRAVIEQKDADLGELVFKGNVAIGYIDTLIEQKKKRADTTLVPLKSNLFFKAHIYVKEQKFKVVLSALEVPFSPLIPSIKMTVRLKDGKPADTEARKAALSLIAGIADAMNRKPANDF